MSLGHDLNHARVIATYTRLYRIAERPTGGAGTEQLYVLCRGIDPMGRVVQGEGGSFYRRAPDGQRVIELDRIAYGERGLHFMQYERPMPTHRIMNEMFVLAHEHGHAISEENNEAGVDYYSDEVLGRFQRDHESQFGPVEKRVLVPRAIYKRVIAEERRAWRHGRVALAALGWRDWRSFNTRARRALATYETARHT